MTWSSPQVPLWSVAREVRTVVNPGSLGSQVFHYSIPVLEATGSGRVEPAEDIGSDKLQLRGNEVLISKLNPRKSRVFAVEPHDLPIVASTEFIGLRPLRIDTRFLVYLLSSEVTRQYLDAQVQSVTRSHQRVTPEIITHMPVTLPSLGEQRRIADFLDAEIGRMDRMAAMSRRLVSLLDERWALQIRRAVSGCNRETESSVVIPWLGPVKRSWPTVHLGVISRTYMGTTFPHQYQGLTSGDLPFIKVADFALADEEQHLRDAGNWITRSVARVLKARVVPAGSILYARVGAAMLLNQRRLVLKDCVIDDNVRALSVHVGHPRYWLYLLGLLDLGHLANPGPVPSVSESQVSAIRVPLPPVAEQETIVDELDHSHRYVRELRSSVSKKLFLLAERRQSLITAAVTGQLDPTTARGVSE